MNTITKKLLASAIVMALSAACMRRPLAVQAARVQAPVRAALAPG